MLPQWTDSDAWQPGYIQRLETVDLIKLLKEEERKLRATVDQARLLSERAREIYDAAENQKGELASTMEGIGESFWVSLSG